MSHWCCLEVRHGCGLDGLTQERNLLAHLLGKPTHIWQIIQHSATKWSQTSFFKLKSSIRITPLREREGYGSRSVHLTYGSGSGSGSFRPKNMRIRIPNTACNILQQKGLKHTFLILKSSNQIAEQ